ncbi:TRAP transporter large permease [Sporosarcina pasteurii]|uniref:Neu5Ac permease n=1 Tax=Sporosarcina pasteurii TaxID=1474 RepID=A0A380C2W6_SPOPA|nr:TRAP transporter large permease [Sporosarcina pasteurii]MDS9471507.1 TRAP transporter large permease [Sporosarcina pasteurii]QBQ04873.1 TRAP transporter large permease [Sporosarcina pasteurii]SUJ10603.1 Neu5Ac permease [Sporosarcina pasteurii]
MIISMLVLFFLLLFLGIPIAYTMGIVSVAMLLVSGVSLEIVVQRMFAGVNSFSYLAIPLFILAGNIMGKGGLTRRLMDLAHVIVGKLTGGLGMTAVVTSALFGTVSGSTVATTYAVGSVVVPELKKEKYSNSFIAAIIGPAGVLGLIIPPSITMVILGITADISIGKLFIAGILPGIVLTIAICIYVAFMAKRKGFGIQEAEPVSRQEFFRIARKAILPLLSPVFILGSIFSGFATATEAAVIAVVYSFILALYYKEIKMKTFKDIMADSALASATILIIISVANVLSYVLTANKIPAMISEFFLQFANTPWQFLLVVSLILLLLGMFLEVTSLIVLLAPIFMPIALQYGIDPIHFGMVLIMNFALANVSPPVGLSLIAGASVTDKNMGIEDTFPYVLHVIGIIAAVVLLIITVPSISTVIPSWFE